MNTSLTSQKEQLLATLDSAYKNTCIEQHKTSDRFDALMPLSEQCYFKKLKTLDWAGISKYMEDENWPATWDEREEFLGKEYDDSPINIKIKSINDKDIRFSIHMLNEVVEQSHRNRSMAKFFETLGSNPNDAYANVLLRFWIDHSVCTQLSNEQLKISEVGKAKSLKELAKGKEMAFDIFANYAELLGKSYQSVNTQRQYQ